jgi:hypothetical protein
MRVHIDIQTRRILGYYPEEEAYPNLPDNLETIADDQYRKAMDINANYLGTDGVVSYDHTLDSEMSEEENTAAIAEMLRQFTPAAP